MHAKCTGIEQIGVRISTGIQIRAPFDSQHFSTVIENSKIILSLGATSGSSPWSANRPGPQLELAGGLKIEKAMDSLGEDQAAFSANPRRVSANPCRLPGDGVDAQDASLVKSTYRMCKTHHKDASDAEDERFSLGAYSVVTRT